MMLEDLYRLLRAGHVQAQGVVDTITQPIVVLDRRYVVSTANNAFLKAFKADRDDVIGASFFDLGNRQWDVPELRELISSIIPKAQAVVGYEVKHDFPTIGQRTFLVDVRRLVHPDDNSMNLLVLFDDVTERQHSDAEKDFIISEMKHRMKNLLAVIKSLAMQTEVAGLTAVEYRDLFVGRLEVTLRAQEIAATTDAADLKTLVHQATGAASERLLCDGPSVRIPSAKAVPVSMLFHELATNALKYGALSTSEGSIHLTWTVSDAEKRTRLRCVWREQNGPVASPPTHEGYGTTLINGIAAHLGGGAELSFAAEGLIADISFPL